MCRHLAYLGPPATLRAVITAPPHGLYAQSWAPRFQRHGTVNADGFGVGWYAPGDPRPARYRRAGPIWADESFADLARVSRSGAILAAVRDATPGSAEGAAAAAPFTSGRWLFSHNGRIDGYPESAAGLAGTLPAAALLELEARVDSALLWALILDRLGRGLPPGGALADTAAALEAAGVTGRFNFLLTDGEVVAATAAGDTLYYRRTPDAVVVASEPGDDQPGWVKVPDQSLVTATAGDLQVTGLRSAAAHLPDERITIP
jgi:glutamine amidotransferase